MPLRNLTNSPLQCPVTYADAKNSVFHARTVADNNSLDENIASITTPRIYDASRVESDQASSSDPYTSPSEARPRNAESDQEAHGRQEESIIITEVHERRNAHRHGWSLNDLDCKSGVQDSWHIVNHQRSPSSDDALGAAASNTYPHLPPQDPPHRIATPEGLPSFGTDEALKLRLLPKSRLYWLGKRIFRRTLASERTRQHEDGANTEQETNTNSHHFNSPAEALRRASGMTRPVTIVDTSKRDRKSQLPRGVKIAREPGDLAIAADGSRVRGRFGNRVSGHGIGQRTIDHHPFARRHTVSELEDRIRAIDKVCNTGSLRELRQADQEVVEYRFMLSTNRSIMHTLSGPQFLVPLLSPAVIAVRNPENADLSAQEAVRQVSGPGYVCQTLRSLDALSQSDQLPEQSCQVPTLSRDPRPRQFSRRGNTTSSDENITQPARMHEPSPYEVPHLLLVSGQSEPTSLIAVNDTAERLDQDQHTSGDEEPRD